MPAVFLLNENICLEMTETVKVLPMKWWFWSLCGSTEGIKSRYGFLLYLRQMILSYFMRTDYIPDLFNHFKWVPIFQKIFQNLYKIINHYCKTTQNASKPYWLMMNLRYSLFFSFYPFHQINFQRSQLSICSSLITIQNR